MIWEALILSLQLALITTALLLIIGIPIADYLRRSNAWFKPILEVLVALPLVLPPTVLGFYLLLAFSPQSAIGSFLTNTLGIQLAFSFPGLVVASMIYSLPFMVQPIQSALSNLPSDISDAAYTMGKSRWNTLLRVELGNIKPAIITALTLTFAHTLGEFGVVLMIGGNIPGVTRVASIAIYDEVESLNFMAANKYALILLGVSFAILLTTYLLNRKSRLEVLK